MVDVRCARFDQTCIKRGHSYIAVVHDFDATRLLLAPLGHDHPTLQGSAQEKQAHRAIRRPSRRRTST